MNTLSSPKNSYFPYINSKNPLKSFFKLNLRPKSVFEIRSFSSNLSMKIFNFEDSTHFRLKNNMKEDVDFVVNEDHGERKNLAIFVSGGGSNFKAIHEAAECGLINGKVLALVTDKPCCGGAEYAKNNGIPVISFPKTESLPDGMSISDLVTTLRNLKVDFIILAGYLKLIPVELVQAYPQRMLNIHPSLLPAFGGKGYYGTKVHKAVIASGARYSGPTVHFVDENFDTGKILAQRVVPVLPKDTVEQLAARVLLEEHKVYVEAVSALCEERVIWREDGVPFIRSRDNPNEYL